MQFTNTAINSYIFLHIGITYKIVCRVGHCSQFNHVDFFYFLIMKMCIGNGDWWLRFVLMFYLQHLECISLLIIYCNQCLYDQFETWSHIVNKYNRLICRILAQPIYNNCLMIILLFLFITYSDRLIWTYLYSVLFY